MRLTNVKLMEAQGALAKLMELDLPIMASLNIALVSNTVDQEVKAFAMVRDKIFKDCQVKAEPGEVAGTVNFRCTAGTEPVKGEEPDEATKKLRQEKLETFAEKFNELMEARTDDMKFAKIQLPSDLKIKPEILKSLTEFVEIEQPA